MICLHGFRLRSPLSTKRLPTLSNLSLPSVISCHNSARKTLRRYPKAVVPTTRRLHSGNLLMSSGSSAKRHLVYRWQDDVENLEAYRSGGYHPIQLGDELSNERYHVIHKLGYGTFSTVWLARDHLENRYVSLKVIKANSSQSSLEAEVEKSLRCGDPHHPGRPFVLSRLDEFYIDGPNGHHRCLVTEVVGPSILDVKEATEHGLLSIDTARKITAQLALGLAYIHSCGIVHGG